MKRTATCLSVAIMVVFMATAAHAQIIETAMRGNTVVAAPSLSTAWVYNPAVLASLAGLDDQGAGLMGWRHAASADLEVSGDTDLFALNWGGSQVRKDFGLGAGYWDFMDGSIFGAGIGKAWKKGMAWGVSWQNMDPDGAGSSENVFSAGLTGHWGGNEYTQMAPVRYGLVVRDITDEMQTTIDVGASVQLPGGILLAADLADLTDEIDSALRIGASMRFGLSNEWQAGIGLDDGDLTVGAMYNSTAGWAGGSWRFGGAFQDLDDADDSLIVGAFATWGM